jgi:hypothetical protein
MNYFTKLGIVVVIGYYTTVYTFNIITKFVVRRLAHEDIRYRIQRREDYSNIYRAIPCNICTNHGETCGCHLGAMKLYDNGYILSFYGLYTSHIWNIQIQRWEIKGG